MTVRSADELFRTMQAVFVSFTWTISALVIGDSNPTSILSSSACEYNSEIVLSGFGAYDMTTSNKPRLGFMLTCNANDFLLATDPSSRI